MCSICLWGTKTYVEDTSVFPNPERGFFYQIYDYASSPNTLTKSQLLNQRTQNITVIRRVYIMDTFKTVPISQAYLTNMTQDFQAAREAGVKLAIRFAYNYTSGGEDTDIAHVLSHLDQLKPILQANGDVIAYQEAGFVGYWGEWHHSLHGLTDPAAEKQILLKELATLPTSRMIALRYSRDKRTIFANTQPLSLTDAFTESDRSRVGYHNDCFLADGTDSGTYKDPTMTVDQVRTFHHAENPYVIEGGETCAFNSTYVSCQNALKDLAYLNFSTLNSGFHQQVLSGWVSGGCMEEIKRRLGYRFRVTQATLPDALKPGGRFQATITVTNDGWASPYNKRLVELMLRNDASKQEYKLVLSEDPRKWFGGQMTTLSIDAGIQSNMPAGQYSVFLHLPDPAQTLYANPNFSIRLANQNMWEAGSGYNKLGVVQIDPNATGSQYTGNVFFVSTNGTSPTVPPISITSPVTPSGGTSFALTLFLHGIGKGGDNTNPTAIGNITPLHTTRVVTVKLFDVTNTQVLQKDASVTYHADTGNFQGTFTDSVQPGLYTAKVRTPQYLQRTLPGIITVTSNTSNTLPTTALISGDSNNDNQLSILDYNVLLDCFSDLTPAKNCTDPARKQAADGNDDGLVNQFDYNLFLRELSVQTSAQ